MRFEISKTVHAPDPEMVLRVLEMCSKDVSSDVIRYGDRITLHGLGPSPRSKNVHDTTVFCVNAEEDKTIVSGEVNFQASALLGNVSQCDVVRSKIDRLFEQVKTQLDIEATQVRVAAPAVRKVVAAAPRGEFVEAPTVVEEYAAVDTASVPHVIEQEPITKEIAPLRKELTLWAEPDKADSIVHGQRLGIWAAGLIVLLVMAVGSFFFYRLYFARASSRQMMMQSAVTRPTDASLTPAPGLSPASEESPVDPKVWLQGWAFTMRTEDAAAQAAFYADPVDRYLGQRNVSRDDVLKDRAATMHMRQGTWTVKIEKIVVEQKSDSEAQVRLVKHFTDERSPSEVLEWFVPSKLTLKRVDGTWKISSEQDLPASSPAFEDSGKQ